MKMNCQRIACCLSDEGHRCTKEGVGKFIIRCNECGTFSKPGTGHKTKLTTNIQRQMQKDDKTTGLELKQILEKEGYIVSVLSILCWRAEIGWTSEGTQILLKFHDK